ncbi:tetratricopeptide repeat protein [Lentiprolixibacter aurantiacus]|uniref:Tetratricopeptide repeat protein n=1 Tax=Lentiprolixibacter aurantiacus TaxID=2993939 RepID=A0AAE3MK22_9FLAO|nr:tetratricopeptide repeat protein [Lentiprolixibacter aurantiacus]MCX2718858.1 tetratricopeptide repeat protein [Lentiprolixibacter aurantiacus]
MKHIWLILILLWGIPAIGQADFLAKQYLNDGDYKKAVVFYERLVKTNPRRPDYVEGLLACYQQLERYKDAEKLLTDRINSKSTSPTLHIELGYNYTLQNLPEEAKKAYETALTFIDANPNFGYLIGMRFERYALLDYALQAYSKAMALNPELDYNYYIARIYGEQGDIEKMYGAFMELLVKGKSPKASILRNIDNFISQNPEDPNNVMLKRLLLQKAQSNPDLLWNELLSWLFVQQRQFNLAFIQEKAIFRRAAESNLQRMESLGEMALEDGAVTQAIPIFEFIEKNSINAVTRLNAQLNLIDIELLDQSDKVPERIDNKFKNLIAEYGYQPETLQLQIAYANFLTFRKGLPGQGEAILKRSLELPLTKYSEAYVKIALGDILVFGQKFNEALINFSQIQKRLKNDPLGQEARYRVAQTSFYKGDFDWALTQLKVLRGSSTQLIANDAMQLSLLISDNTLEDSTQTALKKYARADFLAYQNKTTEAIETLDEILENHKGEKIEDEALLRQGQLLEEMKDYDAARLNYLKVVEFYGQDILADDAHFAIAELYRNFLDQPEKAKYHYEQIIYNYQDSYYFPLARKNFRILRGDVVN